MKNSTFSLLFSVLLMLLVHLDSETQLFGPENELTSTTVNIRDIFSADIDGDGDMDVLSASANDKKIAWYENLGEGEIGP